MHLTATSVIGQSIVINELMSKNDATIQDYEGDYSDWVELYNTTNTPISLLNYSLSDDNNDLDKWTFPKVTISPQGYLLIFASDKNRLDTAELHSNFKISSSGEKLYLSNNLGQLIDQTISIHLNTVQTYGRVPDGSANWRLINTPSPASTNNNSNQLLFSHQEGFYTTPFSIKINSLLPDTIYYTLNGDIPTQNSTIFTDSLLISKRISDPNVLSLIPTTPDQGLVNYKTWEAPNGLVDKATIFRCVSYNKGLKTSSIYSKTFFVNDDGHDKYSMPVISLITKKENLFSPDSGIYVPGLTFNSNNPQRSGNFFMRGDDWERNTHIEYFDTNGNIGFSQDAGVRINGGNTRQATQKSLRLYARDEYGQSSFNYNLLPQRQVNQYDRFLLRSTMGSWRKQTVIKDALAQNISNKLNIDYQEFQPVILFINGEYWGIHTIRDKIDERYIEYTHNVNKDSVEFKDLNNVHYNNLITFIETNDLSINSNYEYVKTQIDIDNYIDYTIVEQFFKNYDWPGNNVSLWRERPNGKWRWILFDLDAGFGDENVNMLIHSTKNDSSVRWPNPISATFLFRNLLKNDNFQDSYINRYTGILNTAFNVDSMKRKFNSMKALYKPEMEDHIHRWNYPDSLSGWENDMEDELLSFIEKRPCVVRTNIMRFFNLSKFGFDCDTTTSINDNSLFSSWQNNNDIVIAPNPSQGVFFLLNYNLNLIDATVIVRNVNGQVVYKVDNVSFTKNERRYFNLSHLPGNTYMVQVVSNNYSVQKKFIIIQ